MTPHPTGAAQALGRKTDSSTGPTWRKHRSAKRPVGQGASRHSACRVDEHNDVHPPGKCGTSRVLPGSREAEGLSRAPLWGGWGTGENVQGCSPQMGSGYRRSGVGDRGRNTQLGPQPPESGRRFPGAHPWDSGAMLRHSEMTRRTPG